MTSETHPWSEVDVHRPRLIGIARSLLGSREAAEESVQEALLRLHELGPSQVECPVAWLSTVTRNIAIDRLRRERRERELFARESWLADVPTPAGSSDGRSPEAVLLARLRRAELIARLVRASTSQATAIVLLREVFGASYRDIAEASGRGRTPEACRQSAHRALQRARRALDAGEGGADEREVELVGRFERAIADGEPGPLFEHLRVSAIQVSAGQAFAGRVSASRAVRRESTGSSVDGSARTTRTRVVFVARHGRVVPMLMLGDLPLCALLRDGRSSRIGLHMPDRINDAPTAGTNRATTGSLKYQRIRELV